MPKYSTEQKRQWVDELRTSDMTVAAAAKTFGVSVSSLRRWETELPAEPDYGIHRQALETSIEAMATQVQHAALVALCRSQADTLDESWAFDEKLAREYRLNLKELAEATSSGGSNDLEEALAELRGLAQMGNTENT